MRIIGGTHKGRRFSVPKAFSSRPTTDMARESLLNVLLNRYHLDELSAIDLFSGTGAVSFEFASRGVQKVIAVENNFKVYRYLLNQLDEFKFSQIKVVKKDVFKFLSGEVHPADIIFADPPYDLKAIDALPELIFDNNWLNHGGCFILEHSKEYNFNDHPQFSHAKKYGSVHFSFFFV